MEQFQNNVLHCKIVKTFNITSSTWKIIKRENLEKSLCTGDKVQNHVCDLWTLSWKSLHGLRNTFGNCCLWINMCHPQMQVKAPSRKKKSCVNSESLLWAKVHLKWIEAKWETVLWSGLLSALNSKACIRDGLRGHRICKGTMNAERYIQVLVQHMLPSRWRLFRKGLAYFRKTVLRRGWRELKTLGASWNTKYNREDPGLLSS